VKKDQTDQGGMKVREMTAIKTRDEAEVTEIIENWARAVRARDYEDILANHSADILMFDVPGPLESRGIDEYRKTWDLFFRWAGNPARFDIQRLEVVAGVDVAFATALMKCWESEKSGEKVELDFRLTIGLRKIDGKWTILHEHHSVPAD
jgi:uncharacterized protein (TIGR02246 family)